MAGKHTLCVPTRTITFGVPVMDDLTGKPLAQHITVTPDAAAWIPNNLVDGFKSRGFVVPYDKTRHCYLPVPEEPVDTHGSIDL